MDFVRGLQCVLCGAEHPVDVAYTCPACGPAGLLDVRYDYPAVARSLTREALAARPHDHWRYRELLPIAAGSPLPALTVGWTPIVPAPRLARHVGVRALHLKDDGRNPTGSLKDRASAVGVVKASEQGKPIIACASTGNAASSLAGMSASLGLRSVIFVPRRAPEPKLAQLLVFGATVLRVQGSYEDAFQLCQRSCERHGWYNRNCAINPYLLEGKKTVGMELCEQLGWRLPDWVAVSVGDGCTIAGAWKGIRELQAIGLIDRTPRMLGVQAEGAAPVTAAFRNRAELAPVDPDTIADSIAVGVPRNWRKAVAAVTESGGEMINVSDREILDAMGYTGRLAGVFAEPAAAAALAGVRRAVAEGVVDAGASVLAVITGNGLKDVRSALAAVGEPYTVPPDGTGLDDLLAKEGLAG
ncbi:MAG: threonine synthase [Acidobacteria bacterium]|nr:threonine synthase [Acidobacteriota bacterium]